jgi:hypothetical protein
MKSWLNSIPVNSAMDLLTDFKLVFGFKVNRAPFWASVLIYYFGFWGIADLESIHRLSIFIRKLLKWITIST